MVAISTSEVTQSPISARPMPTFMASMAVVLAFISPNCTPAVPMQRARVEDTALFSTDIANREDYYNGKTNFYWDGASVMSSDRSDSLFRLLEIEKLPDDWNGNGAAKFTTDILKKAKAIIMSLSVQPAIFPTARDSIQFEYENESGDYLEFELFDNGRLKMFSYSQSGVVTTDDIPIEEINKVVSRFYGRNI